ncbi:MAG: hypothetical protein R3F44_01425 [Candidatus Competibacteraceae bacterium]
MIVHEGLATLECGAGGLAAIGFHWNVTGGRQSLKLLCHLLLGHGPDTACSPASLSVFLDGDRLASPEIA